MSLHRFTNEELVIRSGKVSKFAKDNGLRLTLDMAFINDTYTPARMKYVAAEEVAADPATRTHLAIVNRDIARKEFEPLESHLEDMIKTAPAIKPEELAALDIAPRGGGGGGFHFPPPKTAPEVFVRMTKEVVPGQLILAYHDFGQKLEGRPAHVHAMEMEYVLAPEEIKDPELFTQHLSDTASPVTIYVPGKEGLTLSGRARWVTNAGLYGPWSKPFWFIIPG